MPLTLELTRIALRYLSMYLILRGAPEEWVAPLGDPALVNALAGALSAALAEGGWIATKLKAARG